MMNSFTLDAIISDNVREEESPFGVRSYWCYIKHRSQQVENFEQRSCWFSIAMVLVGDKFSEIVKHLALGVKVKVQGFLTTHQNLKGNNQLVLHVLQIELID